MRNNDSNTNQMVDYIFHKDSTQITVNQKSWGSLVQKKILNDLTPEKCEGQKKHLRYPLNKTNVYMALSIRNKIITEYKQVSIIRWVVLAVYVLLLALTFSMLVFCIISNKTYESLALIASLIIEVFGLMSIITKFVYSEYVDNDYKVLQGIIQQIGNMNSMQEETDFKEVLRENEINIDKQTELLESYSAEFDFDEFDFNDFEFDFNEVENQM